MQKYLIQNLKLLHIVYLFEVLLFIFITLQQVPRSFALALAAVLILYVATSSIDDALVFFIASIPLFIALPISDEFDSLNIWRILSLIIFVRYIWIKKNDIWQLIYSAMISTKKFFIDHAAAIISFLLLILSIVSIIPAIDKVASIKRIIYFINLSFIGIVLFGQLQHSPNLFKRVMKSMALSTILVTIVGILQLLHTYFIDIYGFMRFWGEGVQCMQFGQQWCTIAVNMGNTWLAYYGEFLKLRVFSLFPDTHSFPIYLLLGLSAICALSLQNLDFSTLKSAVRKRATLYIISMPFIFLLMILSGTRGIWAACVGTILWITLILFYASRKKYFEFRRIYLYVSSFVLIFILLFVPAWNIFSSPQFLVHVDDDLLGKRLRSILDFGETSNAARIAIWKASLSSIKNNMLFGVGINNFPVILDEDIRLTKAGSSAHNIYLHIAAEFGLPALILSIFYLLLVLWTAFKNAMYKQDLLIKVYNVGCLIFLPWVLIYLLTDVALFDERAFLFFVVTLSLIFGVSNKNAKTIS